MSVTCSVSVPERRPRARLTRSRKLIEVGEQAERRVTHLHALGGEGEAAAPALAERQAEPGLQCGDIGADGGFAFAEGDFGGGEAAFFSDGVEHAQQSQIALGKLTLEDDRHAPNVPAVCTGRTVAANQYAVMRGLCAPRFMPRVYPLRYSNVVGAPN